MSRRTQDPTRVASNFAYGALTLCGGLSMPFCYLRRPFSVVLLPRASGRFGLLPLRSPLLRESFLFSFPPGTKMFQFPGFSPHTLCIHVRVTALLPLPGSPIRISDGSLARLPLPVAFRRLLRPSSAPSGQAFTVRPCYLITSLLFFLLLLHFFVYPRLNLQLFRKISFCLSSVIRFSKILSS